MVHLHLGEKNIPRRVAAVIIKNNKILLIYRFKKGREYYVLPGGGCKPNETLEKALIREIKEETNLDTTAEKKLWEYKNEYGNGLEHYFLIKNFQGTTRLGGPELKRMGKDNVYRLKWIPLGNLSEVNLLPEAIKKKIIEKFTG